MCWGAKVLIQSSNLDAKAGVHPSLFAKDDIALLTVPTALYPTAEEDMDVFNAIKEGLEKKEFKTIVEHLSGEWSCFVMPLTEPVRPTTAKGVKCLTMILQTSTTALLPPGLISRRKRIARSTFAGAH